MGIDEGVSIEREEDMILNAELDAEEVVDDATEIVEPESAPLMRACAKLMTKPDMPWPNRLGQGLYEVYDWSPLDLASKGTHTVSLDGMLYFRLQDDQGPILVSYKPGELKLFEADTYNEITNLPTIKIIVLGICLTLR